VSLYRTQGGSTHWSPGSAGSRSNVGRRRPSSTVNHTARSTPKQLIGRLLKGRCEICASTDTIEVHHVRRLADLATAGTAQPAWAKIMANKRRKTLVVCDACHDHIHASPTTLTQ
jgi:hypothetical protein